MAALAAATLAAATFGAALADPATTRGLRRARSWVLLAGACGGLAGGLDGLARREACTAALRTGDRVVVTGRVSARAGAAGRGRIRLRLRDVALTTPRGRCALPAVLARVGDEGARPAPGARVRVAGDWTAFEASTAWPAAPDRTGMVTGVLQVEEAPAAVPIPLRLRRAAADRLAARLPADVAPTAMGLVLAERDEIDPDLRRRFVDAGLAHLLAISGLHVGLIAAGVVAVLSLVLGRGARLRAALLLVTGYVVLIGAPPAARRALVMFAGYAWAHQRGWPIRAGELVGMALLAAVLVSPGSLLDPGLQLSFAGFVGVVAGMRAAEAALPAPARSGRRRWPLAVGAAAGALLATAPITAFHFGQTTPIGLVSHFVGGPLVGIGIGGIAATLLLPHWLAGPAADVTTGTLRALHASAELFSRVPAGHRVVAAPTLGGWLAWLALLEGARRWIRSGRPRSAAVPGAFAIVALAVGPLLSLGTRGDALLCTLSVGQGDAAVLRTAGGRWLVFDGGPAWGDWNAGTAIVHPFLRRHGAARVELALLSHPDVDHLGGLRGLLSEIEVVRVADTGDPVPSEAYAGFLADVDAAGVLWLPAAAGDRFRVDGASLTVLGPVRVERAGRQGVPDAAAARTSANSTSLSFRLTVNGGFRYLNTGDAAEAEEAALLGAWPGDSLRADLLKVGHHGSRTSSGAEFLETVAPRLAAISAGARNRYGHPHREVLGRLREAGIDRIWRTDLHGTLCVEIDPEGRWRIRGEPEWRRPGA